MPREGRGSALGRSLASRPVIAFAALTGPLPKLGVVVVAMLAAGALLARERRARAAAMLGALVLAPVLLLADIWHSPQLRVVHRHPLSGGRRPWWWRWPLVGAAAVLDRAPARLFGPAGGARAAVPGPDRGRRARPRTCSCRCTSSSPRARWRDRSRSESRALARRRRRPSRSRRASRAGGSSGCWRCTSCSTRCSRSTRPTSRRRCSRWCSSTCRSRCCSACSADRWTPQLLRTVPAAGRRAGARVRGVGFVEYATKTIFLNPKLVAANDVHTYFTVNSVFFDPDIFGRFLGAGDDPAGRAAALRPRGRASRSRRRVVLAILWGGLVLTLSRSSLGALLVGLGDAGGAALERLARAGRRRWWWSRSARRRSRSRRRRSGSTRASTAPRAGARGSSAAGSDLFGDRPVWGYGSGSFVQRVPRAPPRQLADAVGLAHDPDHDRRRAGPDRRARLPRAGRRRRASRCSAARARDPARAAIAAAFLALVFHTLLYADFLEDPVTWTLLGIGGALAVASRSESEPEPEAEPTKAGPAGGAGSGVNDSRARRQASRAVRRWPRPPR